MSTNAIMPGDPGFVSKDEPMPVPGDPDYPAHQQRQFRNKKLRKEAQQRQALARRDRERDPFGGTDWPPIRDMVEELKKHKASVEVATAARLAGDKNWFRKVYHMPQRLGMSEYQPLLQDMEVPDDGSLYLAAHPYVAYLQKLFKPGDRLCIMWIHATREWAPGKSETASWFQSLEETIAADTLGQLNDAQKDGWNLYVCMNPFIAGATNRTKDRVAALRTVYCEVDENGIAVLEEIRKAVAAGEIPAPHFIIQSSPGKYQFIWCVEGFSTTQQQEQMNSSLQVRFKTDPASVDCVRVLRLVPFLNLKPKYGPNFPMSKIVEENLSEKDRYHPEDFKIKLVDPVRDEKNTEPLSSEEVQKIVNFVTDAVDETGVDYKEVKELPSGAAQICLTECLWGDEHSDNKRGGADAFVNSDGTLGFYCFHSHCQGRDWAAFRTELEERAGHKLKFGESGEDKVIVDGSKRVSVEEYKEMIAEQQQPPHETAKQASVASNIIVTDNSEIVLTDKSDESKAVLTDSAGNVLNLDLSLDEEVPPYNKSLVRGIYADAVHLIAGGTTMPIQFPHLLSKTYLGLRMSVQGVYLQDCEAEPRPYDLLIAEKGGSKGWSEKRTRNLFTCLDKVEPDDQQKQKIKILDGVDSGAGLKEAFFDRPDDAGILLYIDETADLGAKIRSDRNPEIFTTMLTLSDNTHITRSKVKREDRKSKKDARLAVVMCVQPTIIPVVFAGVKAGPLGLWSRLTLEYSAPVEPGREPKMEDRRPEIEKFYAKYLLLDFSKVRINQNDRARKRLEDHWNSLPPNERTEIRRKKNMYVNQFLIQAGQMAGCAELKNTGETTLQDANDAIEDDMRQNIIRRLCLSTEITDNVSGYLAKLKAITAKQREAIRHGAAPESVALTQRDYCDRTNAYRDNEQHWFDRAWRVFAPMYLIHINKAQRGGRKTVWYVPKP